MVASCRSSERKPGGFEGRIRRAITLGEARNEAVDQRLHPTAACARHAPVSALMKVISVNVGGPRRVEWQGRSILTSIVKSPVTGPVIVEPMNLEGDKQSDLTVHGDG